MTGGERSGEHTPASTPSSREDTTPRGLESALDMVVRPGTGRADAFLLVLVGARAGRLFLLDKPVQTIGRSRRCDIRVDERSVSNRHASLHHDGEGHYIVDLGSTNGTFVNDEVVQGEVKLSSGDVIKVGETLLAYLNAGEGEDAERTLELHRMSPQLVAASRYGSRARLARHPPFPPGDIEIRDVDAGPSLRDIIAKVVEMCAFLRRHWRVLVLVTFAFAAAGNLSGYLYPPLSTAIFEIRLAVGPSDNPVQRFERSNLEFFQSTERNFKNAELIRATLEELGEEPSKSRISRVQSRLSMDSVALHTYEGSYKHSDPDEAVRFLSTHVGIYLNTEIEKTLKVIRAEVDFLTDQLAENEAELVRKEKALRAFKEKHIDGLPEQAREQLTSRFELRERRSELRAELQRVTLELRHASQQLRNEEPMLEQKAIAKRPYDDAIIELNRKISEARASGLGEAHPEMKRLRAQLAELRALADEVVARQTSDFDRRANVGYKTLRNRVDDLAVRKQVAEKELERVEADLAAVERIVEKLPAVEEEYAELTRSYDSIKNVHAKIFEQYKASQLQLELERAQAAARYEIITPPTVEEVPLRRTLALRTGIGAFLGLLLALCIAGIQELRRYLSAEKALA